MATRIELIAICEELNITSKGKTKDELDKEMKEEIRERYIGKKYKIPADILSSDLKKYLLQECNFIVRDKQGRHLDHNDKIIKEK